MDLSTTQTSTSTNEHSKLIADNSITGLQQLSEYYWQKYWELQNKPWWQRILSDPTSYLISALAIDVQLEKLQSG